jgi:hypothetical protein
VIRAQEKLVLPDLSEILVQVGRGVQLVLPDQPDRLDLKDLLEEVVRPGRPVTLALAEIPEILEQLAHKVILVRE